MLSGTSIDGNPETHIADKINVFISYSRDDLAFTDQLDAALRLTGFETKLDRNGISGGEGWQQRLENLIRAADTFVFVLSPSSSTSKTCKWEIQIAHESGKRIIPVLCRPLRWISAPKRVAANNYLYFYPDPKSPGSGFGVGLAQLVETLKTIDLDWSREHTRYLGMANHWAAGNDAPTRLLADAGDIQKAMEWAERRPKGLPPPTDLQIKFIRASQTAEHQRNGAIEAARDEREKLLRTLKAESKRADQFIKLVSSNPAGLRAMKKICSEAIDVTSELSSTTNRNDYERSRDRFWELYYGPMYIVEIHQAKNAASGRSAIEASMVRFGRRLASMRRRGEPLPHNSLSTFANLVRDECTAYLGISI